MNATRFDRFARILATDQTRRGAARLLAGGLVAGLLTRRATEPVSALQLDGSNGWAICGEDQLIANLWTETVHCGACFHSCWEELASPSGELVIPVCEHGVCKPRA